MGKATVYAHLGNGLYSILYTPELAATNSRVAELEALKTALDAQLYSGNGLIEARDAAQSVDDAASAAFSAALDDWSACASMFPACPDQAELMQTVMQRGTERAETGRALVTVKSEIARNRAEYFAVTQEIAFLTNTQTGSGGGLMEAWCIDYDPETIIESGTVVGTVETFGARGGYAGGFLPRKWVNIQASAAAAYSAARDHCVKPISGIKTAAMFYNWCKWLYVMSRNPQYAVGVVQTKFDPDQTYLDVVLYGSTPGAFQPTGYPFEPGQTSVMLLNVPVSYLTCGATAFDAGDDVIVRFADVNRGSPLVIGFAQSPRSCLPACNQDWPYHGIVKNGYLTLPNGTARIVPQPANGDVITIQIPGHTTPARTPAEAAADLLAGKTWQNYKTFAGHNRQYNQSCELGNSSHWVWAPAGDTHWHVEIYPAGTLVTSGGTTTLTMHLTLSDPNILTVSEPAATTHSIDIVEVLGGVWTDSFDSGGVASSYIYVTDVSSDGSKVLLAATRRSMEINQGQRGWFLLELTSTTTAVLTVLADHETCNPPAIDIIVPTERWEYSGIPIWMWFDALDAVETVYYGFGLTATLALSGFDVSLTVGGDVVSTYSCYSSSAGAQGYLDDTAIDRLASAFTSAHGRSESEADIYYAQEAQFNAHRWHSFVFDFYAGMEPLPGENPSGARMIVEPVIYSNKSMGLRLAISHHFPSFGEVDTYLLSDTYYGKIIHPTGPTDAGTWISDDGTEPFTLYTPDAGIVHAEPSADYGSYNLQTGQLMRNQTVPVCYL